MERIGFAKEKQLIKEAKATRGQRASSAPSVKELNKHAERKGLNKEINNQIKVTKELHC